MFNIIGVYNRTHIREVIDTADIGSDLANKLEEYRLLFGSDWTVFYEVNTD